MDLQILYEIFKSCTWVTEFHEEQDSFFIEKLNNQSFSKETIQKSLDRCKEDVDSFILNHQNDFLEPLDLNYEICQIIADDLGKSRLGRYENLNDINFKIEYLI